MPYMPLPENQDNSFDEDGAAHDEPVQPGDQGASFAAPPPAQSETQVPPEARGETNGGPLGCCLGVTIGLVLSLSVAVLSRLYATPLTSILHGGLSLTVRIVMVVIAIVASIIFGYLGWRIGKRIYREYELSPRQKQRMERLQQRYQRK